MKLQMSNDSILRSLSLLIKLHFKPGLAICLCASSACRCAVTDYRQWLKYLNLKLFHQPQCANRICSLSCNHLSSDTVKTIKLASFWQIPIFLATNRLFLSYFVKNRLLKVIFLSKSGLKITLWSYSWLAHFRKGINNSKLKPLKDF